MKGNIREICIWNPWQHTVSTYIMGFAGHEVWEILHAKIQFKV
jgi:hypothetical protein